MSLVFSRVDVLTIAQHDAECSSPSLFVRPSPPTFLRPRIDSRHDNNHDDDLKVGTYSSPDSKKSNQYGWLSKITDRDKDLESVIASARRKEEQHLANECKLKVGYYVYTRHKLIAQLSKRVRNKRKFRLPMYGTLIRRSIYQPRFWLVKFRNRQTFYCTEKVLSLVDTVSPSHELCVRKHDKKLSLKKLNYRFTKNQEVFLRLILCSKVHAIPGHPILSFTALYELFRNQYSWLTVGKLKYYAQKLELTNEETEDDTWYNRSFDFIDFEAKVTNEETTENIDCTKTSTYTSTKNNKTMNSICNKVS